MEGEEGMRVDRVRRKSDREYYGLRATLMERNRKYPRRGWSRLTDILEQRRPFRLV